MNINLTDCISSGPFLVHCSFPTRGWALLMYSTDWTFVTLKAGALWWPLHRLRLPVLSAVSPVCDLFAGAQLSSSCSLSFP